MVATIATACLLPFSGPLPAQDGTGAVASFGGGEGASLPNQVPGSAGSGWSTGWQEHLQDCSREEIQTGIAADAQMGGGEPVLSVSKNGTGGSYRISRKVASDQVNPGAPHRVRFQLRVNAFGDSSRPGIAAMATGPSPQSGSVPQALWASGIKNGRWQFLGGTEEGFEEWSDSGIPLQAGQTATFDVAVYPNTRSYRASIQIGESYYQTVNLPFAGESPGLEPVEYWFGSSDESGTFSWSLGPVTVEPLVGDL